MDVHPFSPHIVVIGGGLAGLTASAYLARAGVPVRLFEKAPRPGGRASTEHVDGFAFNRGIHALYTGGATTDVLSDLGISYAAGSPKATFVLSQNQLFAFPASLLELLRSRLLSFRDTIELVRVLATMPRLDPHAIAHTSVEAWLNQSIRRPRVRHLLAATAEGEGAGADQHIRSLL